MDRFDGSGSTSLRRLTVPAPPTSRWDTGAMSHADLVLLGRVAVGIAVAFVFGFERQLRGSPAGDRTFSLVGAAPPRSPR